VRIVIVGGGVIGTALALAGVDRGHAVVQVERSAEPRAASVRNFGLVWICGRAAGRELELALAGRVGWQRVAERAPAVGFRPCGALVLARHPAELALLEAACGAPGAAERQFHMLTPSAARALEPSLAGEFLGALHSPLDAVVEPTAALPALRALAGESGRYRFVSGRAVTAVDARRAVDHVGDAYEGDLVIVACGRALELGDPEGLAGARTDVTRLQMLEVDLGGATPSVALAGGGSLRYYPAFALPERDALPAADVVTERYRLQLLTATRASGRVTVGDTHTADEPGVFGLESEPEELLLRTLGAWLGRDPGRVVRRWSGSYLRRVDGGDPYLQALRADGAYAVTAVGGHGMTGAHAIAAEVLDDLGM
jgi:FAD dependent oxidoreductase TIGR03364